MSSKERQDLADSLAKEYILKHDKDANGKLNPEEAKLMCEEIGSTGIEIAMALLPTHLSENEAVKKQLEE